MMKNFRIGQGKRQASSQTLSPRAMRLARRRKILWGALGCVVLFVIVCLLPSSKPADLVERLDNIEADWIAWEKDVKEFQNFFETESLFAKSEKILDESQTAKRNFDKASASAAEGRRSLMKRSGKEFATEREVQRHEESSDVIKEDLRRQRAGAQAACSSLQGNAREIRQLIDKETDSQSITKKIQELLDRGKMLRDALMILDEKLEGDWKAWKYAGDELTDDGAFVEELFRKVEEYTVYLNGCKKQADNPESERQKQTQIEDMASAAERALEQFPNDKGYVQARHNPKLGKLPQLRFGDADLSIGAEGDLPDTLVVPLLNAWCESKGYTNKVVSVERDDGSAAADVRVLVQTPEGEKKVDVIGITHEQACKEAGTPGLGAHMVFFSGLAKNGTEEGKICADALVFKSKASCTMTLDEIEEAKKVTYPENTPDGIASGLFNLRNTSVQAKAGKGNAQLGDALLAGAYHSIMPKLAATGEGLVGIRYPGNRAYTPNVANISTGLYWFSYDVNCRCISSIAWGGKSFYQFVTADEQTQRVVEAHHFVPLSTRACPELGWLTSEQNLPVGRILGIMGDAGFSGKMQYGAANDETRLRGCQLLYPIFFPTGKDSGMELDSRADQNRLNNTIQAQLEGLNRQKTLVVVVTGHADVRPLSEKGGNASLSQRRAASFLDGILRKAAGEWLQVGDRRGKEKMARAKGGKKARYEGEPATWYVTDNGNMLVICLGCGEKYSLCPEQKGISGPEADSYYRLDRRAGIFVIVPRFED